jgi:hypothetical protein
MLLKELINEDTSICESPQRIHPLKLYRLENPRENEKIARKVLRWTPDAELIETTATGIKLYRQTHGVETEIYGVDEEESRIAYYVRYEVQHSSFVDVEWTTQVLVWRGGTSGPKTKGLAEHVFFTYVLPVHGVVTSDGEQTPEGERFWKLRVPDAFANPTKYKVYIVDFNSRTVTRLKTKRDYENLLNTKNDPWGDTAWHRGIRLVISEFDLIHE